MSEDSAKKRRLLKRRFIKNHKNVVSRPYSVFRGETKHNLFGRRTTDGGRHKHMTLPNYKYTKDHEWIKIEGNTATIGITDHATELLGDIVHVDLPEVGKALNKGDSFSAVESVKSVSDVYTQVSGKVLEANTALNDNAGLINQEPFGQGWIVKLELSNAAETDGLMSADEYEKFAAAEH